MKVAEHPLSALLAVLRRDAPPQAVQRAHRLAIEQFEQQRDASKGRRPRRMPPVMDLATLARFSGIGYRTLEKYIAAPVNPLPSSMPGGKRMVRRDHFERWLAATRRPSSADVKKLAADVLARLRKGK